MRGMLPHHIGELVSASDPRLAPDATRIAYTRASVDVDANRMRTAIFTVALDGDASPTALIARDDANVSLARWSPDGNRIAYVVTCLDEDASGSDIVVRDLASGDDVVVCHTRDGARELEWSPEGTRLAFVARDPDPETYGHDGTSRKEKDTPARRITTFFTRLDDEGWTFDRPLRVFVVDARDGASPVVVTPGPFQAENVAWSVDGRTLVCSTARHETWDLDLVVDLFELAADGSAEPRRITRQVGAYHHASFTPDGRALVALHDPDPHNAPNHARVVRVDVATGDVVVLTDALDRNAAPYPGVRAPIATADGAVLFGYEDSGAVVVGSIDRDGRVTDVVRDAMWVTGFDARGSVIAFTATTDVTTADVHVLTHGGVRRLTDHVASLRAAGVDPAPMQRYVARSTDGTDVECWALRPDGDGPFPTLLNIHGGPFTQYGYKLFDEFQIQVGAGFAVVCCNPRGSSGYSEAWGRAIRWPDAVVDPGTGWGGVDHDDVIACVDTAIEQFDWVDGSRLGVLGGSYGGFMTSWIIGHSDRFGAACSERAVNNLLTEEHNSDIATIFSDTVGVSYLETPSAYTSRSPVQYIREMRTPLLILHSEDDLRCPINQAEELFVGLRLLGRTPEFWRFPGEGHELTRSGAPKHRIQRAEIVVDFFRRHLAAG